MSNLPCYPKRRPGGVRSSTFSKSGNLATATRSSEPVTRSLLPASRSTGFLGAGREGGNPDVLGPELARQLVSPGDVAALAVRIEALLDLRTSLLPRWKSAAACRNGIPSLPDGAELRNDLYRPASRLGARVAIPQECGEATQSVGRTMPHSVTRRPLRARGRRWPLRTRPGSSALPSSPAASSCATFAWWLPSPTACHSS